jgi:hypothetical protein
MICWYLNKVYFNFTVQVTTPHKWFLNFHGRILGCSLRALNIWMVMVPHYSVKGGLENFQTCFWHPSLTCLLFANHTHQSRTANGWQTTNSNTLGRIKLSASFQPRSSQKNPLGPIKLSASIQPRISQKIQFDSSGSFSGRWKICIFPGP